MIKKVSQPRLSPYIDIQDKFGNTFVIKAEKFEGRDLLVRVLREIVHQRKRAAEES